MNERVFEIMEEVLPVGGKHLIEDMVLPLAVKIEELERKNARLQMELDASCNAEELRQVREHNARLREALKWAEPYVPKRADCETRRIIESLLPNVN